MAVNDGVSVEIGVLVALGVWERVTVCVKVGSGVVVNIGTSVVLFAPQPMSNNRRTKPTKY